MAHARSELRASQSQASHPWCAIFCVARATSWYTANLWPNCLLATTSLRRKMHLVKVHNLLACSALCLIRRLWVNIAQIKLTIQLFHVIGFKTPIQRVHFALWCSATHKSIRATVICFSFPSCSPRYNDTDLPVYFIIFVDFFLQGDDFNSTCLVKTVLWVALLKSLVLKKLKKTTTRTKNKQLPPPNLSLLGAIDLSPKDISCSIAHIGRESLLWAQSV